MIFMNDIKTVKSEYSFKNVRTNTTWVIIFMEILICSLRNSKYRWCHTHVRDLWQLLCDFCYGKPVNTKYNLKNMRKSPKQSLTHKCLIGTLITSYYSTAELNYIWLQLLFPVITSVKIVNKCQNRWHTLISSHIF